MMTDYTLHCGDCVDYMATMADNSVDAIISDPPYPMIKRDYGMMTESAWMDMMQEVVRQSRRILKPTGSAVFILQPNSEKVGKMRLWLWEFMVWVGKEWNIVQDAYWWNISAMPQTGVFMGLMRPSVKPCVWVGNDDCYRNQEAVLWEESFRNAQVRMLARAQNDNSLQYKPSGVHFRNLRTTEAAEKRGGVTPFNVLPISNTNSSNSAGSHGHGAGTPLKLADWWTRYICPPGGTVCDPFTGSGTMGIAALQNGCSFIGCERMPNYFEIARQRIETQAQTVQPTLLEVA
jgi:DNA modification methylase